MFVDSYLFSERGREEERMGGEGRGEAGGDRRRTEGEVQAPKPTPCSTEPETGLDLTTLRSCPGPEIKNQERNQMSCPGAPGGSYMA